MSLESPEVWFPCNFTGSGIKGRLSKAWFEGLGMVPVDRNDTRAASGGRRPTPMRRNSSTLTFSGRRLSR